jgi:hypothetical protein
MNKMNDRETYLYNNIEKLFIGFKPGTFLSLVGKEPGKPSKVTTPSGVMNIIKKFDDDRASGTNGIDSMKNYKPDLNPLKAEFDALRNKSIHGGNLIISLSTIKQYINETVNNITPK